MANLSLQVRSDGPSCVVIAVAGEIDLATAPQLADCLREHQDTDVIVDLSQVSFLDSSGINALVQAYRRLRGQGRSLRAAHEQDHVRAVLKASGVDGYLHADAPDSGE